MRRPIDRVIHLLSPNEYSLMGMLEKEIIALETNKKIVKAVTIGMVGTAHTAKVVYQDK